MENIDQVLRVALIVMLIAFTVTFTIVSFVVLQIFWYFRNIIREANNAAIAVRAARHGARSVGILIFDSIINLLKKG